MKLLKRKHKCLIISLMICFAYASNSGADNGNTHQQGAIGFKIIKDLDDKMIEVPVNPQRIAMLHGPSYDRILMLGGMDAVALLPMKPSPWCFIFYPDVKNIPVITSYVTLDIEQMINYKVDLVFYSTHPEQGKKLDQAGIKTACPFSENKRPKDLNGFIEGYKRQIMFFGEILGPEATLRATNYCKYFDKMLNRVISITSNIKEQDKPTVYYGGLEGSLFSTQGENTVMHWCVTAAGGRYLPKGFKTHFAKVNMEELISWDPDFIFIGMKGSLDMLNSPALKNLKAVKENNTYMVPAGSFWWDLASGETIFLPLFLAKKFHPDLFADLDLSGEMKNFYAEFYGYKISDEEIERILKALPPL